MGVKVLSTEHRGIREWRDRGHRMRVAWHEANCRASDRVFERTYTLGHRPTADYWIDRQLGGGDALLEFGCGVGFHIAARVRQRYARVYATDILDVPVPEVAAGVEFTKCTETLPYADASFDAIAIRSVVEHLIDPPRTFRELARVLRPGGCIVMNLPNRWDYVSLAARVAGRWKHAVLEALLEEKDWDDFPIFYRANTRRALARAMAGTGLCITRWRPLPSEPSYLRAFAPLYVAGTIYQFGISLLGLDVLQPAFLVRLEKAA